MTYLWLWNRPIASCTRMTSNVGIESCFHWLFFVIGASLSCFIYRYFLLCLVFVQLCCLCLLLSVREYVYLFSQMLFTSMFRLFNSFQFSLVCFVFLSIKLSHLPLNVCVESCFYNCVTFSILTSAVFCISIFCYVFPSCTFLMYISFSLYLEFVYFFTQISCTSMFGI